MRTFSLHSAPAVFATMLAEIHHESHRALERAARVVEKEAKAEIGDYQGAAGPFAAWAPLAERTVADRVAKGFTPDDPLLRTGHLRDSIGHSVEMSPGITSGHAVVGSKEDIAVWQELGTSRIPARSFLGGAAVRKTHEVVKIIGGGLVQGLVGPGVKIAIP